MCIDAMIKAEEIEIIYIGGSTPGTPRKISVSLVFQTQTDGGVYVAGFCRDRGANRIFRD
jgi:predicted DNA-binding transcriptional regulator YafY